MTIEVAHMDASMDPRDEYLVIKTVINHTRKEDIAKIGLIAIIVPKDVATPFPPLNLRNTENICPIIENKLTSSILIRGSDSFIAIKVGKKPLKESNISTIIPYFVPSVLITFAVPIFPLPCLVMSIPLVFAMIYPVGILPNR